MTDDLIARLREYESKAASTADPMVAVYWYERAGELVATNLPAILSALAERDRMRSLAHVKSIAAKVVQDACETDPADPEHPDTVMISTDDLEMIVRQALEPTHAKD